MTSLWDDPEIRVGGDFVKLEQPGDTVAGTISAVRAHTFDDGKKVPQVILTTDDGEEKTLTAGQVRLKSALAEQRPEAGDHITVTLTELESRAGGKTLKHFDVSIKRASEQQAQQAPAQPAAPQGGQQQGAAGSSEQAAALANLTEEQKAALGLS